MATSESSFLGSTEASDFEALADSLSEMEETTSDVAEYFYFNILIFLTNRQKGAPLVK